MTAQERMLRVCKHKIKYALLSTAQKIADRDSKRLKEKIEPYVCEICGSFHVGHPREIEMDAVDIKSLILVKLRDGLNNNYVFAVPPGVDDRDPDVVMEHGKLVAYKKGRDAFKEKGGVRSLHWPSLNFLMPVYVAEKDMVRFQEEIEVHMNNMLSLLPPPKNKKNHSEVPAAEAPKEQTPSAEEQPAAELPPEEKMVCIPLTLIEELVGLSKPGASVSGDYFAGFANAKLSEYLN